MDHVFSHENVNPGQPVLLDSTSHFRGVSDTSEFVTDGSLVQPSPAGAPADLLDLVQQLRREVLQLGQEVTSLRRENDQRGGASPWAWHPRTEAAPTSPRALPRRHGAVEPGDV